MFSGKQETFPEGQDPNQFGRDQDEVQLASITGLGLNDSMGYRPHLQDVVNFHEHFGFTESYQIPDTPDHIQDSAIAVLRMNFLQEELNEYAEASGMEFDAEEGKWYRAVDPDETSLARALDGLLDLQYVLLGTVHLHGFAPVWDTAWSRVQQANMLKIRVENAADSKRGSTFDVRKPEGWTPPQFDDLLFY